MPRSQSAIHAAVPAAHVNVQCINAQMAHTAAQVTPHEMPRRTANAMMIANASPIVLRLLCGVRSFLCR